MQMVPNNFHKRRWLRAQRPGIRQRLARSKPQGLGFFDQAWSYVTPQERQTVPDSVHSSRWIDVKSKSGSFTQQKGSSKPTLSMCTVKQGNPTKMILWNQWSAFEERKHHPWKSPFILSRFKSRTSLFSQILAIKHLNNARNLAGWRLARPVHGPSWDPGV